jgi:hypothetical protein
MLYTMLSRGSNGDLYIAGFSTKDWPTNSFILDDGGGVPYFQPTFTSAGIHEGFITSFCASALTGIDEAAADKPDPPVFRHEDGTLFISGLRPGLQTCIVHDVLGQVVHNGRSRADGSGRLILPIGPLSTGAYIFGAAGAMNVPFVVAR